MVRGYTDLNKKRKAIILRKRGKSYRDIEKSLNINRSTLSGWLKDIKLNDKQKEELHNKWLNALAKAREKASLVHKKRRSDRREKIRKEVEDFYLNIDDKIKEVIFATFYLAEGTKKEGSFAIANSNPLILKSLVNLLRSVYSINEAKFRCCLHLRKDQEENELKKFWSKLLNISKNKFGKTQFDKRTIKKTYDHYKGVCIVYYYDTALQRRVLYLGNKLLEIINKGA
jgi:hypothetical protein